MHNAHIDRFHILRTLGHDEVVRTQQRLSRIAQLSVWKQMIALDRAVCVDDYDIDKRIDIAMLETIIHNNEIYLRMLGLDTVYGLGSFLAHYNQRIWKF